MSRGLRFRVPTFTHTRSCCGLSRRGVTRDANRELPDRQRSVSLAEGVTNSMPWFRRASVAPSLSRRFSWSRRSKMEPMTSFTMS